MQHSPRTAIALTFPEQLWKNGEKTRKIFSQISLSGGAINEEDQSLARLPAGGGGGRKKRQFGNAAAAVSHVLTAPLRGDIFLPLRHGTEFLVPSHPSNQRITDYGECRSLADISADTYRLVQKKFTIVLRRPRKSRVAAACGRTRAFLALHAQPGTSFFCSTPYICARIFADMTFIGRDTQYMHLYTYKFIPTNMVF